MTNDGITLTLLAALMAAGPSGAAPAADPVVVGIPRVQLFYNVSGRLSPNVAPPAKFTMWNTVIAEGDAAEPAEDALVTVPVRARARDTVVSTTRPLTITARDSAGKLLATRTFRADSLMVPRDGATHPRLWLSDIVCKGPVTIEARHGAQRRRVAVNFACGE